MTNKADELLKKLESEKSEEREHSLRENAVLRAQNPLQINAGTAFDWEDMDGYARELERMDKEKPYQKPKV
jgi:hypothetical protein